MKLLLYQHFNVFWKIAPVLLPFRSLQDNGRHLLDRTRQWGVLSVGNPCVQLDGGLSSQTDKPPGEHRPEVTLWWTDREVQQSRDLRTHTGNNLQPLTGKCKSSNYRPMCVTHREMTELFILLNIFWLKSILRNHLLKPRWNQCRFFFF